MSTRAYGAGAHMVHTLHMVHTHAYHEAHDNVGQKVPTQMRDLTETVEIIDLLL